MAVATWKRCNFLWVVDVASRSGAPEGGTNPRILPGRLATAGSSAVVCPDDIREYCSSTRVNIRTGLCFSTDAMRMNSATEVCDLPLSRAMYRGRVHFRRYAAWSWLTSASMRQRRIVAATASCNWRCSKISSASDIVGKIAGPDVATACPAGTSAARCSGDSGRGYLGALLAFTRGFQHAGLLLGTDTCRRSTEDRQAVPATGSGSPRAPRGRGKQR
jgi:hypothetical protein